MPDQQVTETPRKIVPGETDIKPQLQKLRKEVSGDSPSEVDPIELGKKLVVDNYNESRNVRRTPAMTPELITIVWFTGSRMNWKMAAEITVVHNIRYEVSYNAYRHEANINVYQKVKSLKRSI